MRFEQIWVGNEDCNNIVKDVWLNNQHMTTFQKNQICLNKLHKWHMDNIGIIPKKIKDLQSQIDIHYSKPNYQDNIATVKDLENQLDKVLELEEGWWNKIAKVSWLKNGDKNTRFFHQKASQRRSRNLIQSLQDENGDIVQEEVELVNLLNNYFQNIFSTSNPNNISEIT